MIVTSPLDRPVLPHRVRTACMLAVAALTAACGSPTEATVRAWEAELAPTTPQGVMGSVAVVSQAGRTESSILIESAAADTTYGWRINHGGCDPHAAGNLVGGSAVYPELTAGASGTASVETTFADVLDADAAYAARVTLAESGTVVACGPLERVR